MTQTIMLNKDTTQLLPPFKAGLGGGCTSDIFVKEILPLFVSIKLASAVLDIG